MPPKERGGNFTIFMSTVMSKGGTIIADNENEVNTAWNIQN